MKLLNQFKQFINRNQQSRNFHKEITELLAEIQQFNSHQSECLRSYTQRLQKWAELQGRKNSLLSAFYSEVYGDTVVPLYKKIRL